MGYTNVRVENCTCSTCKTGKERVGLRILEAQKLFALIQPDNLVVLKQGL